MALLHHCMTCTSIDGCYYVSTNMPEQPLHPHCDCDKKSVSYTRFVAIAKAECDIRKFRNYIFIDKNKRALFEKMGYTIDSSEFLQNEICNTSRKPRICRIKKLYRCIQTETPFLHISGIQWGKGMLYARNRPRSIYL